MMYVKTESTSANFHFALEEYLLTECDVSDSYFLFWRTTPTLMVGKFQNTLAEINQTYVNQNNINVVRRITGGGTIYTDMNGWQFSYILKNHISGEMDFETFTRPVIDALASIDVLAYKSGRNDLLIDDKKFSGNAQYKTSTTHLHHGSLLFNTDLERMVRALNVDDQKIISKGIKSVRERVTNIADYLEAPMTSLAFRDVMLKYLTRDMPQYTLNKADLAAVDKIKKEKFDSWEWNYGKSPQFEISRSERFAGGKLEVKCNVKQGELVDIAFYGDFFEQQDLTELRNALIGCRYAEKDIKAALNSVDADRFIFGITAEEIAQVICAC